MHLLSCYGHAIPTSGAICQELSVVIKEAEMVNPISNPQEAAARSGFLFAHFFNNFSSVYVRGQTFLEAG